MPPHPRRKPSVAEVFIEGSKAPTVRRLLTYFIAVITVCTCVFVLFVKEGSGHSAADSSRPPIEIVRTILSNAHKKPPPVNSTAFTSSWYENWNWLNPFQTSEDYYESRSVLPPLPQRCPIYVYYDQHVSATSQTAVDNEVMKLWRKAWWAAGFKPIILSPDDSKEHGQYTKVVRDLKEARIAPGMEYNLMRWLAWDHMGTGVLADFRVFPMAVKGDALMKQLRRCQFGDKITRFENFGGGLYAGAGSGISAVVQQVTAKSEIDPAITSPADVVPDLFNIDALPKGLAYYSKKTLSETYRDIAPQQLPKLINAHLHWNFLAQYASIKVLNPQTPQSDVYTQPSFEFANRLATCPDSPIANSCPPNFAGCVLCHPLPVELENAYHVKPSVFTIGTIPHPFTTTTLVHEKYDIQIPFVRRESKRDLYLKSVTPELPTHAGALYRAMKLKETMAQPPDQLSSLWFIAEAPIDVIDASFILGFTPPDPKAKTPPELGKEGLEAKKRKKNMELFSYAKTAVGSKVTRMVKILAVVESWNLGDFEIWKFTKSFAERRKAERVKWTGEEREYSLGIGKNE